jgi:hypothetical protein
LTDKFVKIFSDASSLYNMPSFSLFHLQDKNGLKKLVLRASTCKKEEIIEIIKKVM